MRLVSVLLLAAAAAPAAAQDLPIAVPDRATWTMTVERTRERTREGATPQILRSTSTTDVDWAATGEEGGVATLRLRSVRLDSPGAAAIDTAGLLNQPVELEVDASLAPTRVRNWPQVRALLEQEIDKATPDATAAAAAKRIFAGLSPEQAVQVVAREWSLATLGQGTSLELGKPVSYKDKLPNPLGGPPIDTDGTFELQSYDKAGGGAVIAWTQAFDPKSASASIRQTLNAMTVRLAPDRAKEAEIAFADMSISREDACRHEIDIPTGLALKVVCTSAITSGARGETATNLDRWTITQTRPQPSAELN